MAEPRKLRTYQYVTYPYERVRKLLHERGQELFQGATRTAAARADSLGATLSVDAGGFQIGVDVNIHIESVKDDKSAEGSAVRGAAGSGQVTRVTLRWEAARGAAFFPSMEAELSAWSLSATETQLEIYGEYTPPLGAVGSALDALVGHRIAEASVHRFLEDLAEAIRRELA